MYDYSENAPKFWIEAGTEEKPVIKIEQTLLLEFLKYYGFFKMYLSNNSMFVRISKNIISEVTAEQIKDFVLDYIRFAPRNLTKNTNNNHILSELVRGINVYLGKGVLQCLEAITPDIKMDDPETAYFYFKNCFVVVTKDNSVMAGYSHLDRLIWKNQILNRKFYIYDEDTSDFEIFLKKICKGDEIRYKSLISAIGYLLHSYKDPVIPKAIIFCDADRSKIPNGRTGKSLVGEAIGKLKNTKNIDGRKFNFNDRFAYQGISLDTQVINFNDVSANFDFEKLFSVLTDGITVEEKGRKSFDIPYEKSPKVLVTTNYTVVGEGESFKGRMFEVEFSEHYSSSYQPIHEFGKRFFDNWDKEEWYIFYTFMLKCVQFYLNHGLVAYESPNLKRKKLEQMTSKEFCIFADKIELNKEYNKRMLFEDFKNEVEDIYFSQRTFTTWLRIYAGYNNIKVEERKSNNEQFIFFKKILENI